MKFFTNVTRLPLMPKVISRLHFGCICILVIVYSPSALVMVLMRKLLFFVSIVPIVNSRPNESNLGYMAGAFWFFCMFLCDHILIYPSFTVWLVLPDFGGWTQIHKGLSHLIEPFRKSFLSMLHPSIHSRPCSSYHYWLTIHSPHLWHGPEFRVTVMEIKIANFSAPFNIPEINATKN